MLRRSAGTVTLWQCHTVSAVGARVKRAYDRWGPGLGHSKATCEVFILRSSVGTENVRLCD